LVHPAAVRFSGRRLFHCFRQVDERKKRKKRKKAQNPLDNWNKQM